MDDFLFPTKEDLSPDKVFGLVEPNVTRGPYPSYEKLLETQCCLMQEDFLRALNEQVNELRQDPSVLDTRSCYHVTAVRVREKRCGRLVHQLGVDLMFNADMYADVKWIAEKRFLNGNLVFLTQNNMQDFILGVVHNAGLHLLRKGIVVIQLCYGVKDTTYFKTLDHNAVVGHSFKLAEANAFYFPYLHVTNVLRSELEHRRFRSDLLTHFYEPAQAQSIMSNWDVGGAYQFDDELVNARFPSRPPKTVSLSESAMGAAILQVIKQPLNQSQREALDSVLRRRVALVQGPPGTGKTFLACKIAEYFVELKRALPTQLLGPILVVSTTNHAIDEFLIRCQDFTEKIVHGYSMHHEQKDYGPLQREYNKAPFKEKISCMKKAEILAMTTARAAFTKDQLHNLNVKIVIVEEAAEALESHILASITWTTEHIIQIGDHKQLRPCTAHVELARSSHLDVSLFERLINNGADCPMLNEQRRMRPLMARMLKSIYPTLTNDDCTLNRPVVAGVDLKTPVFFFNHNEPETPEGTGYYNNFEAKMVAQLGNYLLVNDYDAEQITILTTYRRQLIHVLKAVKEIGGEARKMRITTVDNFQGEESDIIILSLVRSNLEGNIGFLALENRACVALSRARDGFFIFGNLNCMTASGSSVWKHVEDTLCEAEVRPGEKIGSVLALRCPHGKKFLVNSDEGLRAAEKGCVVCEIYRSWVAAKRAVERSTAKMERGRVELQKRQMDLRKVGNDLDVEDIEHRQKKLSETEQWLEEVKEELPVRIKRQEATHERWKMVSSLFEEGKINILTDTVETVEMMRPEDNMRMTRLRLLVEALQIEK